MLGSVIGSDTDPLRNSMNPLLSLVRRELFPPVVQDSFPPTDFNTSCDVVYIDGIHTYEGVKEDILHWKPQLNTVKSVICGHDYYTDEEFLKIHTHISGVKQAIDELLGKPDKTYSDGSWIKYL
jgi:hypothetical protein